MIRNFVLLFILSVLSVGCSETRIVGHKMANIGAPIKQLVVVLDNKTKYKTDFNKEHKAPYIEIANKIVDKIFLVVAKRLPVVFAKNNINAKVYLTTESLETINQNEFPYLLTIAPDSASIKHRGGNNIEMLATIFDFSQKKIVWRGAIAYSESQYALINEDMADNFANKILLQLHKIGFIHLQSNDPLLASADLKPLENPSSAEMATQKPARSSGYSKESTEKLVKTDESYNKIITWIKENNKWGPDAKIINSFQKQANSAIGKYKAVWEIGWELMKSGRDYRIEWTNNNLDITEFSPEEAIKRGIKKSSVRFSLK